MSSHQSWVACAIENPAKERELRDRGCEVIRLPGPHGKVDLAALIEDRATDWHDAALERGADLGFELAPATVRGVGLFTMSFARSGSNLLRSSGRNLMNWMSSIGSFPSVSA